MSRGTLKTISLVREEWGVLQANLVSTKCHGSVIRSGAEGKANRKRPVLPVGPSWDALMRLWVRPLEQATQWRVRLATAIQSR